MFHFNSLILIVMKMLNTIIQLIFACFHFMDESIIKKLEATSAMMYLLIGLRCLSILCNSSINQ